MNKYSQNFTRGNITEQIVKFSTPFVLGNICMQLYNYSDSVIVGHYLGKEALAAVGASTPLIFVIVSFVTGITIGASIIVSRYFALNDRLKITQTSDTINIISVILGVAITFGAWLFIDDILSFFSLETQVKDYAINYLSIYILGIIPTFGYTALTALLRGIGNSTTPLYFLVYTAILNIILDLFFVIYLGLGIEAVAWASVIAQFLAYLVLGFYVNHKIKIIRLNILPKNINISIAKECLWLGIPTSIQQLVVSFGSLTLVSIVTLFGTDVVAAYTSAQRILILIMVIPINISLALTTFVAQNYAVNNYDRIRKALKETLKISMIAGFAILIIISMFSTNIMQTFTKDTNIINIGKQYLMIISLSFWIFNIMMMFNGTIRGLGNTIAPMIITAISLWIVKIPVAYILSKHINEVGVWLAEPISWSVGAVVIILYYIYYLKKKGFRNQ